MIRLHNMFLRGFLACIVLWLLIAISSLWLMTLGTDEAWNLNGLRSLTEPYMADLSSELISTSGGLFAIGNLVIEYAVGSQVWAHRLFSLVCYLVLLATLIWGPYGGVTSTACRTSRYLLIAPVLAVPGTAEICSMALGSSVAVLLLILACLLWCQQATPRTVRAVICGCLCGLAAASRFEMILALPGIFLYGLFHRRERGWNSLWPAKSEIVLAVIAVAVFVTNLAMMTDFQNHDSLANATGTSSLLRFMDYPRQLNKILVAQSFVPFGVLVAFSVLPFWHTTNESRYLPSRRLSVLLIAIGWILAIAWFLQAPIPHLRYLWPSLVCVAIPTGFVLRDVYDRALQRDNVFRKIACPVIASALVLGSAAGSFRSIVIGEQDYVSWEWSREMRADYFRRFQHVQDQTAVATAILQLPKEAVVACYIQPFPLRYLTHRPIVLLDDYLENPGASEKQLYLVLSPGIGLYAHLSPEAYIWIEQNCRLQAEFGAYSLYEVSVDRLPTAPDRLQPWYREYAGHPLSKPWFGRHFKE